MRETPSILLAALLLAPAVACRREAPAPVASSAPAGAARPDGDVDAPVVAFLGDSLTAGLGVPESDAWPAVLGSDLARQGHAIRVVNAGVSGDTTAGGLARIDWVLRSNPTLVVVELGANDGLRGEPLANIEANLRGILDRVKARHARALLCGMRLPPNYGDDYAQGFAAIFPRVSADEGVPLVPFLLEGVAGHPDLNQKDGIHPTTQGHLIVAGVVEPFVERALLR